MYLEIISVLYRPSEGTENNTMLTEETKTTICMLCSIPQGLVAIGLIVEWVREDRRAKRFGVVMGPYKHQLLLFVLVAGCLVTALGAGWYSSRKTTEVTGAHKQQAAADAATTSPPKDSASSNPLAGESLPKRNISKHALSARLEPRSQQVAAPPTYSQQCVGSACAQGPGAQATFNQVGVPPRRITD